jgi:hypothetical protein
LEDVTDFEIDRHSVVTDRTRHIGFSITRPDYGRPREDYDLMPFVDGKESVTLPYSVARDCSGTPRRGSRQRREAVSTAWTVRQSCGLAGRQRLGLSYDRLGAAGFPRRAFSYEMAGVRRESVQANRSPQPIPARPASNCRTAAATNTPRLPTLQHLKRLLHWKDGGVRKKLVLIALLPSGIAWGHVFYLSCAAGFAISHYCGGEESGSPGRVKSIIIPLRRHELHLHHWFLATLAAVGSALQGFFLVRPELFYGVLGGLVLQGIYCYKDWHRIVKRRAILPAVQEADTANC